MLPELRRPSWVEAAAEVCLFIWGWSGIVCSIWRGISASTQLVGVPIVGGLVQMLYKLIFIYLFFYTVSSGGMGAPLLNLLSISIETGSSFLTTLEIDLHGPTY